MTYHNTTDSKGRERVKFQNKAASQEQVILDFFSRQGGSWTPSEVNARALPAAPITSVRRAMSNLTDRGLLKKTDQQKEGPLGRPEYYWEKPPRQLRLVS